MRKFIILILTALLSLPLFAMDTLPLPTKKIFILLGAPGAGKGTQAVRLSDQFQIPQISTGDLFRENLRSNTAVGQKAKSYMDKGLLVPDQVVLDMLFERISREDCCKGFILDGFPRTIPQAEALDRYLDTIDAQIVAINLDVPDQIIVERLTGRLVCEKCGAPYHKVFTPPKIPGVCDRDGATLIQRKDDSEEVVKDRLVVYHEQTEPLIGYYQKQGYLITVDGTVSPENTINQLDKALEQKGIRFRG